MSILDHYHRLVEFAEEDLNMRFLSPSGAENQDSQLEKRIQEAPEVYRHRLWLEFFGLGPLQSLIENEEVTEILVNGPNSIWFETHGHLHRHSDHFFSEVSYKNSIERLSQKAQQHLSLNHPFIEGHWENMRISIVDSNLTKSHSAISLRKHPKSPWTLKRLVENQWCEAHHILLLRDILRSGANFLVVGETGSGKTSILNALLHELDPQERAVIIEDSSELQIPNDVSLKLLTREDASGILKTIDQQELLKRALRLRPDRLAMGEIRNSEAKDFLMLLATGHKGCFATLHAGQAHEALMRLEMLIQLGAPQWSLQSIRRLIYLSLQYIIVTERNSQGRRYLKGLYKLSSLEESGVTLDPVDSWVREATSSDLGA